MTNNYIELRRKKYFKLSSQIAQLDNAQLRSLFDDSESSTLNSGWGQNHTIFIGKSKVFVKRVPVTNLEYDNLFSTKNLGIKEGLQPYKMRSILLDNIEQIHADGDMKLDEFYVASIVKYRSIIALMQDFFADMWANNKKDTKFDYVKLHLLLKEARFL